MDGEAEFNAFFREQYPKVVAKLISYDGFAAQMAEEAAAEAMTQLYSNMGKVRSPKAWVRVVALNAARRLTKGTHPGLPESGVADVRAQEELATVETGLLAGAALESLPPRQQEVMALTLADLTPAEIAEVLGCTSEQARANLAHARRTLRRTLGTEEEA